MNLLIFYLSSNKKPYLIHKPVRILITESDVMLVMVLAQGKQKKPGEEVGRLNPNLLQPDWHLTKVKPTILNRNTLTQKYSHNSGRFRLFVQDTFNETKINS